jgi:hypothetical protein
MTILSLHRNTEYALAQVNKRSPYRIFRGLKLNEEPKLEDFVLII